MNHCVPDFNMDGHYSVTASSLLTPPTKSSPPMVEDDVMELLWRKGPVVLHSQHQRSPKKQPPSKPDDAVIPPDQSATRETVSSHHHHRQHLFMQEDEMASWHHYPLNDTSFDSDFCADLLCPLATCVTSATATPTPIRTAQVTESRPLNTVVSASASRPPIPPQRTDNFMHFCRRKPRAAEISGPSNSKIVAIRESTVVDSSDTPALAPESRVSEARSTEGASGGNMIGGGTATVSSAGVGVARDLVSCEMTVPSSPGVSSASAEPAQKPAFENRKRKGREADEECHSALSQDVELESADAKKQAHGTTSTKRSRAAEIHNLSERRRRHRINEKLRALQELVPHCNKSDKASMLDEALEYLKSLQLQVQMMSMGCGIVPMTFPCIQQYIPNMGMGMGMGMGMMPFPNIIPGSSTLPTLTAAAAHLGPRFPMPAYMQPVPAPHPSRVQANIQPDPMLNSFGMQLQNTNRPPVAKFADPYQQYIGLHQMQLPVVEANSSKLSNSTGPKNPENHPSG